MWKKNLPFYLIFAIVTVINIILVGVPKLTFLNFGVPLLLIVISWTIFKYIESRIGGFENQRQAFYYWFFVLVILLGCLFFVLNSQNQLEVNKKETEYELTKVSQDNYDKLINSTTEIDSKKNKELISQNNNNIIYIGRRSCPYCQQFITTLEPSILKTQAKVYYLNTEEKDKELFDFADKYQIKEIPQLLVFKENEIVEKYDRSTNQEGLIDFLKKYN